jgi:hypothetical protein
VREADTQLYAVGMFDPLSYRSRTPEELNGPSLLSELTELTGGRAFDVENANELPDIAAKIGAELRNQYILGYRPSNKSHDARWRKIKVKLGVPQGTSASQYLRKNRLLCARPLDSPISKCLEAIGYRVLIELFRATLRWKSMLWRLRTNARQFSVQRGKPIRRIRSSKRGSERRGSKPGRIRTPGLKRSS